MHRSSSSSISSSSSSLFRRYRLLLIITALILLLVVFLIYHTNKSLSIIGRSSSSSSSVSIHSVELNALRKLRKQNNENKFIRNENHQTSNSNHDDHYGFLSDGFDPFSSSTNCSQFIQRFEMRNALLKKNRQNNHQKKLHGAGEVHYFERQQHTQQRQAEARGGSQPHPTRAEKRKYILDKWTTSQLPDALILQLLTYKVRVLLKLFHGQNTQLWKPIWEKTYQLVKERYEGHGDGDHIAADTTSFESKAIDDRIEKMSVSEKLRFQQEYQLTNKNSHHNHHQTSSSLSSSTCYDEFPECSAWSRSDIQLIVKNTKLDPEMKKIPSSSSSAQSTVINPYLHDQIAEFKKNERTFSASGRKYLLNFVDLFMNVKCCQEHSQLKKALRGTFSRLSVIKQLRYSVNDISEEIMEYSGPSLTAGSLLASVREEGFFIPWDTDIDLLIQPKDENLVRKYLFKPTRVLPPAIGGVDEDENDNNDAKENVVGCYTKLLDPPREVDHGRLLGYVYSTPPWKKPHHEEDSRVEIWVAKNDKKMQKRSIVFEVDCFLPQKSCSLQEIGDDEDEELQGEVKCPKFPERVLEGGYGMGWCTACKARNSNCK